MQQKVSINGDSKVSVAGDCDEPSTDGPMSPPTVLTDVQRSELFGIIDALPDLIGSPQKLENSIQRFCRILDVYQEQPTSLDCCLEQIIGELLSKITWMKNGQSRFDELSNSAFFLLCHISKVRGYKTILSLLPHEANYLEIVLCNLQRYSNSNSDPTSCYVLLLWLVILCKNPFDLSRFNVKGGSNTVERIIDVSLPFLHGKTGKPQYVAALLLAMVATREDARDKYLPMLVELCINDIKSFTGNDLVVIDHVISSFILLAAILKKGRREDLLPIAQPILEVLKNFTEPEECQMVLRKMVSKVFQRLGLVFLKPKVPKWRYSLGHRCLTFQSPNSPKKSAEIFDDTEEESFSNIPEDELEIVLGSVIKALHDNFTAVRWTAAKGIGRILSRLPKMYANDVLNNIFAKNFHPYSGNSAWHGGCMAIAELARRGFLPLERLPDVVSVVIKALTFEEPKGRHAVGANVRDAACFICWSLARAFRPEDLKRYVDQISAALVCAALFDREVNVRRAASAAFQENVGRQGTFSDGIAILTKIDYFAIGQRNRAYLSIACEIAQFKAYTRPIIEHLINYKIVHWDEEIRILAAETLQKLCAADPIFVSQHVLDKLVSLVDIESLVARQGSILAFSAVLSGLHGCGFAIDRSYYAKISDIFKKSYSACVRKQSVLGSTLMCRALHLSIKMLSPAISLDLIQPSDWFRCLELSVADDNKSIRRNACEAFFTLFCNYSTSEVLVERILNIYLKQVIDATSEAKRIETASLFCAIPKYILLLESPASGSIVAWDVVQALIDLILKPKSLDVGWAYARRSCVDAITSVIATGGIEPIADIHALIDCLIRCLDDYTRDERGDIGRCLRESTLRAISIILPRVPSHKDYENAIDKAICKAVQQSCENIDITRMCAAQAIHDLLVSGMNGIVEMELLHGIYVEKVTDWKFPECFTILSRLLKNAHYRYYALRGFVISAGGLTQPTMKFALDALISVVADYRDSPQKLENFLQCLFCITKDKVGLARYTFPLLRTFDHILSAQLLEPFESNPDSSQALKGMVGYVCAHAANKEKTQKVGICATLMCHLLHFDRNSQIWHQAATLVTETLGSPYPVLRRSVAERLYENLVADDDCEFSDHIDARYQLLTLLSQTEWQREGDFTNISSEVAKLLKEK